MKTWLLRCVATVALVAASGTFAAQPALALDDAEKAEIGAYIKEYLIANPEIMLDVQRALKKKQEEAQIKQSQDAIAKNTAAIFSSEFDVTLGNPAGDVTIVEFYDYNCGYCKRALTDMDAILKADSNVRFVLKELPILGPDSVAAHKVSAAFKLLAPEKYGDFHRQLLGGQERATEASAMAVAVGLGVTEEAIRAKMPVDGQDPAIEQAYTLANDLGISGTPSYVIGTEMLPGAVGVEEIAAKIANMRSCGKPAC